MDLTDQLNRMRRETKSALADAQTATELQLRNECMQKVKELKDLYEQKIQDATKRLRREHEDEADDSEQKMTDEAESKIKEFREKLEKDETPWEWREAHEKAVTILREEEDRLAATKKRLENLTGQPVVVKELRIPRPTEAEIAKRTGERQAERAPAPVRTEKAEGPLDDYSDYYSDEFEDEEPPLPRQTRPRAEDTR
jgi:exonuclease VII large subunit